MLNKSLKKRIIEIAYKNKAAHIGSCLTAVDIINEIYKKMRPQDVFILSSGHAALALYVILEKFKGHDAEVLYKKHGTHPNRDEDIFCSSGSLGHGLPIAVGMAITSPDKTIYVLTSDGEWAEGSMEESARIIEEIKMGEHDITSTLSNLKVYININGFGAYKSINKNMMAWKFGGTGFYLRKTNVNQLPFLHNLDAHYHVMSDNDYAEAMDILS